MWPAGDETNKSGRFNSRFEIKDLCYKLHRKHHCHGIMGNGCIVLGSWHSRGTESQDIWAFDDMNSTVPFKNLSLVSSSTLWKNCTWMLECPFNIYFCVNTIAGNAVNPWEELLRINQLDGMLWFNRYFIPSPTKKRKIQSLHHNINISRYKIELWEKISSFQVPPAFITH